MFFYSIIYLYNSKGVSNMNGDVNYLKKDGTKLSVVFSIFIVCFCYAIYLANDTYAAKSYTVVFNRAEGTEVMNKCTTDANGKLNSSCVDISGRICGRWSTDKYQYSGYDQKDPIDVSKFYDMTFSSDINYYCDAGSSYKTADDVGCYVCEKDNNIMKWDTNGDSDTNCSSGYSFMEGKSIDECKTVVVKESCYVCKNNTNIMKWDTDGNSDNSCSSGYHKINANEDECKYVENPPTGDNIVLALVWFIGLGCLGYSVYYFNELKKKK